MSQPRDPSRLGDSVSEFGPQATTLSAQHFPSCLWFTNIRTDLDPMSKHPAPDYEGLQVDQSQWLPEALPHSDKEAIPQVQQYGEYNATQKPRRGRICGISRKLFFLLLAIGLAIIIAAVGGGVGGYFAGRKSTSPTASSSTNTSNASKTATATAASGTNSDPGSTNTASITLAVASASSTGSATTTRGASTTSTTSSASATATAGMGSYFCPSENGTTYTPSIASSYTFQFLCSIDFPSGARAASGTVTDLNAVVATSMRSCIDQCAAYRLAGGDCSAVTYGANITLALSRGGISGNCFLKDEKPLVGSVDRSGQVESAFLVSD